MLNVDASRIGAKVLPNNSTSRIPQLDGWRGVSIVLVITGHLLNIRYSSYTSSGAEFPVVGHLATWGVDIFFVISGFIITKLALAEKRLSGHFSVRGFYIRRCFRIIPPFFLY